MKIVALGESDNRVHQLQRQGGEWETFAFKTVSVRNMEKKVT